MSTIRVVWVEVFPLSFSQFPIAVVSRQVSKELWQPYVSLVSELRECTVLPSGLTGLLWSVGPPRWVRQLHFPSVWINPGSYSACSVQVILVCEGLRFLTCLMSRLSEKKQQTFFYSIELSLVASKTNHTLFLWFTSYLMLSVIF